MNLRITVVDETHDKTYNLNFPGSHTVLQVKRDVATVTDIPVFRQSWSGWPEDCNDDLSLLQVGLQSEAVLRVNLVRRHDKQDNTEVGDSYVILDMMCDITLTEKCGKLTDFPKKKQFCS